MLSQKLEELEKEEELREKAGLYEDDESEEDDEMKEIRQTAKKYDYFERNFSIGLTCLKSISELGKSVNLKF